MAYDEWLINRSWRHAQVESCQGQTYVINIWFSLFSWEPCGGSELAAYPLDCFLWACGLDWLAITRTTHNKTTRSSAVGLWNNDPVRSNLFSERNKNAHIALMMSPVCQIPCVRLTRHWLSMKMFHSGSAAIGERASAVTPELGTKSLFAALRLFDIVTRLLLCVQAILSWTLWDPTKKCSYKTQG